MIESNHLWLATRGFELRSFCVNHLKLYTFTDFKYQYLADAVLRGKVPFSFMSVISETRQYKLQSYRCEKMREMIEEVYKNNAISKEFYEVQQYVTQPCVCATVKRVFKLGPFTNVQELTVVRPFHQDWWRTFTKNGALIPTAGEIIERLEKNVHKPFIKEVLQLHMKEEKRRLDY